MQCRFLIHYKITYTSSAWHFQMYLVAWVAKSSAIMNLIGQDYKNPLHLDVVDWSLRRFIPHESQKNISTKKHCDNSVSQLPHHPHPKMEVTWSCTWTYGKAKDFFVVPNSVCHLPRLQSFQYDDISITTVCVSMYDILVSRIFCHM